MWVMDREGEGGERKRGHGYNPCPLGKELESQMRASRTDPESERICR